MTPKRYRRYPPNGCTPWILWLAAIWILIGIVVVRILA